MFIICNEGRTAINSKAIDCVFVRYYYGRYCVCVTTCGSAEGDYFTISKPYDNEDEATRALHKTLEIIGENSILINHDVDVDVDGDEFIFNPTMKQIENFFNVS